MAGQRYKTVLLDADNTLFDFDAAEAQALARTMEARGLAFDRERLEGYLAINVPLWQAFHRGEVTQEWLTVERFRRFGQTLGCQADPAAWNRDYLDRLGECAILLPGALELLAALKPYCVLALATNGLQRVQRRRLADSPVAPYLDGVFISQELGVGKPSAAYFRQVLQTLGAQPSTAVMVGDDLHSDIQGAINAGIDSIWYSPTGASSPLPTYRAGTLEEVADIVLGREK